MTLNTIYCPSCGAKAADDDAFCAECGSHLRRSPEPGAEPHLHDAAAAGTEPPQATRTAQYRTEDRRTPSRNTSFDPAKLDLAARVAAVCGLLALIDSFLPWYTVSFAGVGLASANAWDLNYAWVPILLLLGLGVTVIAPAFNTGTRRTIGPALIAVVGTIAAVIIAIRWATYPTGSDLGVSAGAGVGTYLALALALIVTGFGVRTDATHDRMLIRFFNPSKKSGDHRPPPGT